MIKALCTVSTKNVVTLNIEGKLPEVGSYYFLESAVDGTSAQNKVFHALTMEYFQSGQHSYECSNYADFKNMIKRHLGEGFEGFVYVDFTDDGHPKMFDVKKKKDIPAHLLNDPNMKDMIRGKLKSWSDYTKRQRQKTIDTLIDEMLQAGMNTKKFEEILKGMKHDI
ncbi:MAG: hypothetical protein GY804_04170 [Alphaproteobacteria bacterium]|nr:hypothetical protein [Alphaproteobacteria bacterium]